jgi:hypothetical protein
MVFKSLSDSFDLFQQISIRALAIAKNRHQLISTCVYQSVPLGVGAAELIPARVG